jgi:hypothetical protein
MPPSNLDVLRRELAEQGVEPSSLSGRWLARLLSRGEWSRSESPPAGGGPAEKKGRPPRPRKPAVNPQPQPSTPTRKTGEDV